MDGRKPVWIGLIVAGLLLALTGAAEAFYVDEDSTLSIAAKLSTRVTFRLQDAEENGTSYPKDIGVGDLVQWRNLALIEIDHDLENLTEDLDILWPLKKLEIQSKYHIVGRFMYEAVYNVGPQAFRDVRDNDKENIDNFKQAYDLWEAYIDFSRGPAFIRIGRQILAWGETDIFRLLDGINPLDNSFGGPFEDLDDRRIPLWMLRGSYNLGTLGPFSSLTLEGFWVPGTWDAKMAPWPPFGTPYMVPNPKKETYDRLFIRHPAKDMSNSRWGGRIQWMFGPNMNCSIAHYKSFPDLPTTFFVLKEPLGENEPLLDFSNIAILADYVSRNVTGGSITFWESMTDIIFRGEIAQFWDEAVWERSQNARPLTADYIPLGGFALDALAVFAGEDPRSFGFFGIPVGNESGNIAKRDILRWMIGFDKQIWMRKLNKTSMFFTSFQYFGQWIQDHRDDTLLPVPDPNQFVPSDGRAPGPYTINSITGEPVIDYTILPHIKKTEHTITMLINTSYLKGNLTPQFACAYNFRGIWLFLPSINYIREPFRFGIQYAGIVGNWVDFGIFRDKDQIAFTFAYLLN
jgi:hypothetical protein